MNIRTLAWMAAAAAAYAQAATRSLVDDFSRYSPAQPAADAWEFRGGSWRVDRGRLVGSGRHWCFAAWLEAPDSSEQTLSCDVVMLRRGGSGSWFSAGLCVFWDRRNFWRAALVESPEGRRYFELVEMLNGRWQAQTFGASALRRLPSPPANAAWDYAKPYRVEIRLDRKSIRARFLDSSGRELASIGYALDSAQAVKEGRLAVNTAGGEAAFAHARVAARADAARRRALAEPGPSGVAAVVNYPISSIRHVRLASALRQAGFAVVNVEPKRLCDDAFWTASGLDLMALPECDRFPAKGVRGLKRFLRGGGKLICIGGKPFEHMLYDVGGGLWGDEQAIARARNATPAETMFYDFEKGAGGRWRRSTANPAAGSRVVVDAPGANGTRGALRFEIKDFKNWDTFAAPRARHAFKPGQTLTCFWAKGGPRTTQISVEWTESDGSRWIAVVPLSTRWRHYALPPNEFRYWRDNPSKGRGGSGDAFRPAHAAALVFGVASSHCRLAPGDHVFWVDEIGAARDPYADCVHVEAPLIEGVSPFYKTFELRGAASVKPTSAGRRLGLTSWPTPREPIYAPIPRPSGQGFNQGRTRRWTPLADAYDRGGEQRGTVAAWVLNYAGLGRGSQWLFIGQRLADADPGVAAFIARAARRMANCVALGEAGTEHFTYFTGEVVTLGARVCNFSRAPASAAVTFSISRGSSERFRRAIAVELPPGRVQRLTTTWRPKPDDRGVWRAAATLEVGGRRVDAIDHEFRIVRKTEPPWPNELVRVRGDHFELGGERWYPFGVNFWPTYIAGCESLAWLEPEYYQPDIVERNLELCRRMGMNMLSIQSGSPAAVRNLRDFLERAYARGIRLNVFLHAANPLNFRGQGVRDIIERAGLTGHPGVFAYDIAWEHRLGRYAARRRWDREWERWIVERYGSVAAAEKDWKFSAPRRGGRLTGPNDAQVTNDGPWRVMVAAYRRFVDDLISRSYRLAVERIRRIDPYHLIGVRSGYGGTGPCHPSNFPIDIKSGAKHLDFTSPEGYGMHGPYDNLRGCGVTTAYCRFVGAGKPVFWCEYGMSVWDRAARRPDPKRIAQQGEYYRMFFRMLLETGADGSAPWFFPGGYRVNERSDYGIVNPDYTLRPAGVAAKEIAARFCSPRPVPTPNAWITIDRDSHPGGYWHVYNSHRKEFGALLAAGKTPGLRTAATGSTSATCPLLAVGNTPWNGSNPPKYLNAEFNWVRGDAKTITASAGNLEEATWLAPRGQTMEGGVWLLVSAGREVVARIPLPRDTAYHEDVRFGPFARPRPGALRLQLAARRGGKDVRFGEIALVKARP